MALIRTVTTTILSLKISLDSGSRNPNMLEAQKLDSSLDNLHGRGGRVKHGTGGRVKKKSEMLLEERGVYV